MPTSLSYASQVSPPIIHNQGLHDLDIFISAGIFGAARPSIILNVLSPPLKLCCTFFHCTIREGGQGGGGTGITWAESGVEGAESGVEGAESGVEGAGSGGRGERG